MPHRDEIGLIQFITVHLADSLPEQVIEKLQAISELGPDAFQENGLEEKLDAWLNRGYGYSVLANSRVAEVGLGVS